MGSKYEIKLARKVLLKLTIFDVKILWDYKLNKNQDDVIEEIKSRKQCGEIIKNC